MSKPRKIPPATKPGPHPRNRHRTRYDFPALIAACPGLARFVIAHPLGGDTIDFSEPAAVTMLNRALLFHDYGLTEWEVPPGYLCPPIPGRADYVHQVADLLTGGGATIPRGPAVRVLDIGIGANAIYPIIGIGEYGWSFVGSDIDATSVASARRIAETNACLRGRLEVRLQPTATAIFRGVVHDGDRFDAVLCNPPFHASAAEAAEGTLRKLRNLAGGARVDKPVLNFGGRGNELWCAGGESGFVRRMIAESVPLAGRCRWFTTLVSKRGSLQMIYHTLEQARATDIRTVPMSQGQKHSRLVAWTFLTPEQHAGWAAGR